MLAVSACCDYQYPSHWCQYVHAADMGALGFKIGCTVGSATQVQKKVTMVTAQKIKFPEINYILNYDISL